MQFCQFYFVVEKTCSSLMKTAISEFQIFSKRSVKETVSCENEQIKFNF